MTTLSTLIERNDVMTTFVKFITGTAFALVLTLTTAVATQAADELTMKPLQGISFDFESKHAVSYFLRDDGTCKLVLTLAGEPDLGEVPSFTATRFEAAIGAGKTARFEVSQGKSLEFACHAGAQVMSVRGLEQVASSPGR
jgi:hypothetical protein